MQSLHKPKIRDLRRKNYFTVDNDFIDTYASELGTIACMIYLTLCRHADRNQESFPSQETIAKKLNTTRQTVNEKIKILETYKMIATTHVIEEKTGQKLNNIYTLLDRSEWKPMSAQTTGGYVGSDDTAQARTHVGSDDTNNTHVLKKPIENFGITEDNFKDKEWKEAQRLRKEKKLNNGFRTGSRSFGGNVPAKSPTPLFTKREGVADGRHIR